MGDVGFEPQRGVRAVSRQTGFARIEVAVSPTDRLVCLKSLAEAGVSHKFLQLSPEGIRFIVPSAALRAALESAGKHGWPVSADQHVSVLVVQAPSIREEPRLAAEAAAATLASGAIILHSGDMHDRIYLVVADADAESAIAALKRQWGLA